MQILDKINSPKDIKKLGPKAMKQLAAEIREFLIQSVSKTGGHLGSNLGTVELTLALHYCLDSPKDKILWDVGHQAYTHKIITGRKNEFDTLRKFRGLSGFPKKSESVHDIFDVGHSSTSISSALGIAKSRDLMGQDFKVAAVIGDGSVTGGMAYEAFNNAGRTNTDMLVILNDNQMSISENVGAISQHLNEIRTSPKYLGAKKDINKILRKVPIVGHKAAKIVEKTKDSIKYLLVPGILFEEMGFKYVGPIDGHNIEQLISVINRAKKMKGPVLLHVYTKKGKGFEPAEKYPATFHGVDKFNVETGRPIKTKIWDSYSDVFGKTLLKLAKNNEKIVSITAAMPEATGLSAFSRVLPNRFFDVGIAEAHAVTFAAGMAQNGHIPVFSVYSSFLQRGYDQLIHDVCIQNAHVVFMVDRAGIVGADGETHQGIFDISFLSHMPNMMVMAPKNKREFKQMIEFAINATGPVAVRYPRGSASMVLGKYDNPIVKGRAEIIEKGEKIALVSFGAMMDNVYELYLALLEKGYQPSLINARFAKPVDMRMVEFLGNYEYVFTFEDNVVAGGFGSIVLNAMNSIEKIPGKFVACGFEDEFIPQGSREELFDFYGLSINKLLEKVLATVEGEHLIERRQFPN